MDLLVTRTAKGPWQISVFHNQEVPREAPGPAQGTTVGLPG
jgi:hypothetical protein